jgi:DNA topoisomerase-1
LDEARALFAQPKQRRGRTAAPPLRELGADPSTNLPVVIKDGRFGPYVTDGTTNASLRKGDSVESVDIDRASELLAERRAAGPSTRKKKAAAKKAPAKKKAAAKKAPAKKKAAAKKAGAKKTAAKAAGRAKPAAGADSAESAQPADPAMRAASTEPF